MSFDVPADLRYRDSHEWLRPDDGRVGISDFAQDELGDVVFVELPAEGDRIERDEPFGVVESIKAVSDLYAPVTGTVAAVNDDLAQAPELLNEDPYGDGWLIEVEYEGDLEHLLSPAAYREQIE